MLLGVKEEYRKAIINPKIAAEIFRNVLSLENEIDQNKEHFWSIGLNTKNIALYVELVTLGILNHSLVHPREIFRTAIFKATARIIIGHNHPSGSLDISWDDRQITERLKQAGEILGIELLDHIVIGNNSPGYACLENGIWCIKEGKAHPENSGHNQNVLKVKNKKLEEVIKSDKKIQNALKEMNEAASQLLTIKLA